jgi:hypothetical protein
VARTKLAALFKLPPEQVGHLFSGNPIAVKRGVNMDVAIKYRTAFRDAGALIEIKPIANTGGSEAAPIPDTAPATAVDQAPPTASTPSSLELTPANTGTLEDCIPEVIPVEIGDISQISMAEVGSTIDESKPPARLEIDTSALSLESDEGR